MIFTVAGGEPRYLLQQRGKIQGISRAVVQIHQILDKPVSVEGLVEMVNKGQTSIYKIFRTVVQILPL